MTNDAESLPVPVEGRDVTAEEAMSSPVATVPETGTILDAWTVMVTCGVRHTVVVRDDHCLGVLDDRALVNAWHAGPGALRATPVKQLLSGRTSCVLRDASLRQVAQIMESAYIDAVPVVEPDGTLMGLITATDVLRTVSQLGLHVRVGSEPAEEP
jgi:CBS domain-containing protein